MPETRTTLQEWELECQEYNESIRSFQSEIGDDSLRYIYQPRGLPDDLFRKLWKLSDYVVDSTGGGIIWLSLRTQFHFTYLDHMEHESTH